MIWKIQVYESELQKHYCWKEEKKEFEYFKHKLNSAVHTVCFTDLGKLNLLKVI
jgi:hypothetical protein